VLLIFDSHSPRFSAQRLLPFLATPQFLDTRPSTLQRSRHPLTTILEWQDNLGGYRACSPFTHSTVSSKPVTPYFSNLMQRPVSQAPHHNSIRQTSFLAYRFVLHGFGTEYRSSMEEYDSSSRHQHHYPPIHILAQTPSHIPSRRSHQTTSPHRLNLLRILVIYYVFKSIQHLNPNPSFTCTLQRILTVDLFLYPLGRA